MGGLSLSMAPWAQASVAFAVAGLLALREPEQYAAWGWRALFAIGAVLSLGMLVYYRRQVTDAPLFHRQEARTRAPEAPAPPTAATPAAAPNRPSLSRW